MPDCAFCGRANLIKTWDPPSGLWKMRPIDRDGFGCGPTVYLCGECHTLDRDEVWERISTFMDIPDKYVDRVLHLYEDHAFGMGLVCRDHLRGARWFVGLCMSWMGSTVWTSTHRRVKFEDLLDRLELDEVLQRAVSASYRAGSGKYQILDMVHSWRGGDDE